MTQLTQSVIVDPSAVKRIKQLRTEQGKDALRLRITVDSGGCSGFQYIRALDDTTNDDDHIFGDVIICDEISLPYLNNAIVSFKETLAGSDFEINNPNAVQGCGCGTSFSVA